MRPLTVSAGTAALDDSEGLAMELTVSETGGKALLKWIVDLPWTRVAIWLTVGLVAAQLKDFFGVSCPGLPLMYHVSSSVWGQRPC